VTHPLGASHFRTVISGTLGILVQHDLTGFHEELFQKLVTVVRRASQKQIEGAQEIFKRFSAIKNFFSAPFSCNVFVSAREILNKIGEDSLNACGETERQLIQFVKAFDPDGLLAATLQQIADQREWKLDGLFLLGLSLDEPLDASLGELLQRAISFLDLSHWSGDQEFTVACLVLARCANATADSTFYKEVIDKLTEAWVKLAQQPTQYSTILSAIIQTLTDGHIAEPATAFYRWWTEAIEKAQGQLPEEIAESPIWLAWQLPVKHQQGLSEVKAKLLMLESFCSGRDSSNSENEEINSCNRRWHRNLIVLLYSVLCLKMLLVGLFSLRTSV
jgi:hypothetical protein